MEPDVTVTADEPEDDTYDIQVTTDYAGNAAEKGEMQAFEWDDFTLSQFNFGELMEMLDNDQQLDALVTQVRSNFINYYSD